MSYEEPGAAEAFTIRVRKKVIAQPSVHWFNTYECRFHGVGESTDLDSLAAGLVEFEANLLLNVYAIDQVTISTWAEDSHPYNPMSFATIPYARAGDRALGVGVAADLRTALFVKRTVESGRIGRIFLRGYFKVDDLGSNGVEWNDPNMGDTADAIAAAVSAGGLTGNFESGLSNPWLALIGEGMVTRNILGFTYGGIAQIKLNHKYFDRA